MDARIFLTKAETEVEEDKKTRHYHLAEKNFELAARLYGEAGYELEKEKTLKRLERTQEEKEILTLPLEVAVGPQLPSDAPDISSFYLHRERPVGLGYFEHAEIYSNTTSNTSEVIVGQDIIVEMAMINAGKNPAFLTKMTGIVMEGLELRKTPLLYNLKKTHLDMKGRRLDPLKTEELKLTYRSLKKGTYTIKPQIHYLGASGKYRSHELEPVEIQVSKIILPGRITTGYADLDNLLFGGIPKNYAVILTSPSCDEKELLIKRFLEAGAKEGQITFYITMEASGVKNLVEQFQLTFHLFICNPQADKIIKSLPNVTKMKGVENLTDISIALTSAFRRLDKSLKGPRRACVEIVSDILLQHHAVQTRRWLTGLIPELKSKGFTTLAVMNPQMHSSEEVHAIVGLFEGEINIYEPARAKKFLRIKKMYNQRYLESELPLKKGKLRTQKKMKKSK